MSMDFRVRPIAVIFLFPLLLGGIAFAASLPNDVPEDAWYGETLQMFLEDGTPILEDSRFRPEDDATRAEFVELLAQIALAHG